MPITRNPTRAVRVGSITLGAGHRIAIQSMTATRTRNADATIAQVRQLHEAGADLVRIAVDSRKDVQALVPIRAATTVNLSVDLQENYRLAEQVAPHVDKIRYNPGHLYHHEPEKAWQDKVRYLVDVVESHDCALRVGVNCGSVDPAHHSRGENDELDAMLASALAHCDLLDRLGFTRYCVSLKDSDPAKVIEVNRRFAAERPSVPLHLGVTEAGMPPEGILKTRLALEPLLRDGIGDTVRVSLTVPNDCKREEILAARDLLAAVQSAVQSDLQADLRADLQADLQAGRSRTPPDDQLTPLNIISCPSCSRVENEAFVDLAQRVREMTVYARDYSISIAVMGCRVNGPGETDDADLGLWCGPSVVNLKRGTRDLGAFPYDEILDRLKQELDALIAEQLESPGNSGK